MLKLDGYRLALLACTVAGFVLAAVFPAGKTALCGTGGLASIVGVGN